MLQPEWGSVRPWEMGSFTPDELEQIADAMEAYDAEMKRQTAKSKQGKRGGRGRKR